MSYPSLGAHRPVVVSLVVAALSVCVGPAPAGATVGRPGATRFHPVGGRRERSDAALTVASKCKKTAYGSIDVIANSSAKVAVHELAPQGFTCADALPAAKAIIAEVAGDHWTGSFKAGAFSCRFTVAPTVSTAGDGQKVRQGGGKCYLAVSQPLVFQYMQFSGT